MHHVAKIRLASLSSTIRRSCLILPRDTNKYRLSQHLDKFKKQILFLNISYCLPIRKCTAVCMLNKYHVWLVARSNKRLLHLIETKCDGLVWMTLCADMGIWFALLSYFPCPCSMGDRPATCVSPNPVIFTTTSVLNFQLLKSAGQKKINIAVKLWEELHFLIGFQSLIHLRWAF